MSLFKRLLWEKKIYADLEGQDNTLEKQNYLVEFTACFLDPQGQK
jgi:hypothetical protein